MIQDLRIFLYPVRIALMLFTLLWAGLAYGKDIAVYSTEGPLQEYTQLINNRPNFMHDQQPLQLKMSQRAVSEIHLYHEAVSRSGLGVSLILKPESTTMQRAFILAQAGRMISFTETYSHVDIVDKRDNFYISQPVLNKGEYPVGLYTSIDNNYARTTKAHQLSRLSAASHPQWHTDWSILESLNLTHIHPVDSMLSALDLVAKQKADFVLRAFQAGEGFTFTHKGGVFVPIVGVKVFFHDSRHFLVSKKHPNGQRLFEALQIGLEKMRERGDITKIYQRFGVMDKRVDDWVVVNKAALDR